MDYSGTFVVRYENKTLYYSAYGSEDEDFFNNKYRNPYFGYRYNLTQPNPAIEEFVVTFFKGDIVLYP